MSTAARPLRADARRNHERLLSAARDVFIEQGPEAPLQAVADRAGVGIGTVYRRFGDRQQLMRAVVLDALARATVAAERVGLSEYLHAALDIRIAALIPALLGSVELEDKEIRRARRRSTAAMQRLVDAAHAGGELRRDVSAADIGMLLVRVSRPLRGGIPPELDQRLAHRHLDLILDGLRLTGQPLRGPALTIDDLSRGSF